MITIEIKYDAWGYPSLMLIRHTRQDLNFTVTDVQILRLDKSALMECKDIVNAIGLPALGDSLPLQRCKPGSSQTFLVPNG